MGRVKEWVGSKGIRNTASCKDALRFRCRLQMNSLALFQWGTVVDHLALLAFAAMVRSHKGL
jgi:hypothetical protein